MRAGPVGSARRVTGRLPLRVRVMVAVGLGSLLVTSLLALLTWNLSTSYMLSQRERGAVRQANVNALLVQATLRRDSMGLADLLTGLGAEAESAVLLVDDGQWITSRNLVDPNRLPVGLLRMVERGQPARQRIVLDGVPVLAVGLPLPDLAATYVEVVPLRELDRTFRFLSWMLVAATAVSGALGAWIGRWAASRALRPLTRLTTAAAVAAAGDLTVRLPDTDDPDLAPLAAAFNETTERLQQRVIRDARFASDVSHELRSPLTTMVNAMAVLQRRRHELPASAQQAVDLLGTDLHRFGRMVTDLLEISRADQSPDQRILEPVDLAELVRAAARRHRVAVDVSVPDLPAPWVLADRRRLERVVANLVDNAERHGQRLLRLAVLRRAGQARIEVDDAGAGVPAGEREQIFERFARGSPVDRQTADTGAGLGLALVAQHVRLHGGRVWVEDRRGGGARFVVELPEVDR